MSENERYLACLEVLAKFWQLSIYIMLQFFDAESQVTTQNMHTTNITQFKVFRIFQSVSKANKFNMNSPFLVGGQY